MDESQIKSEHFFILADAMDCPSSVHVVRNADDWNPGRTATLTLCVFQMEDGSVVTGESLMEPESFEAELGRAAAREHAVSKFTARVLP